LPPVLRAGRNDDKVRWVATVPAPPILAGAKSSGTAAHSPVGLSRGTKANAVCINRPSYVRRRCLTNEGL